MALTFPLVSIVITSYNYGHFIGRTIESALAQEYPNLEVLICENGSQDNSIEVISSFQSDPRLRVIRNASNLGVIGNLNKGVAESKGDYIVFLSADDYFLPGHIWDSVEFYATHPHVDVLYGPAIIVDDDGRPVQVLEQRGYPRSDLVWGRAEFSELLVHDSFMCFPTILFRRELFSDFGALDETLHIAADYEFVIRLAAADKVFGFRNTPRVAVRYHADNHSSAANYAGSGRQIEDYLAILERYVLPEHYPKLAGFGSAIATLLETRVHDVRQHAVGCDLLARLDSRLEAVRARAQEIPLLGDPRLHDERPVVSVIIPTIGAVGLLDRALQSLFAQDYPNWEAIVVSDGGADLSAYLASLPFFQKVRYVRDRESRGPGRARNRAHDLVRGEVVAYLDEDNCFRSGYLSRLARAFSDPGVMVSRCNADLLIVQSNRPANASRKVLARHDAAFSGSAADLVSLIKSDTPLNCVAHRRACTLAIGGFDESLPVLEDWQFILRLSSQFKPIIIEESFIEIYYDRLMGDNASLRNWSMYLPTLERLYNAYAAPQFAPRRREFVNDLVARVQALQASGHGQAEAFALIMLVSGSPAAKGIPA